MKKQKRFLALLLTGLLTIPASIGAGAECSYLITDKEVTVAPDRILTSSPEYPMYVSKGAYL